MCAEFLRLTEVNVVDSLQNMLDKHGLAMVHLVSNSGTTAPPLVSEHIQRTETAKSQEIRRGLF